MDGNSRFALPEEEISARLAGVRYDTLAKALERIRHARTHNTSTMAFLEVLSSLPVFYREAGETAVTELDWNALLEDARRTNETLTAAETAVSSDLVGLRQMTFGPRP